MMMAKVTELNGTLQSLMSKDMFDERFEKTKEDLLSTTQM